MRRTLTLALTALLVAAPAGLVGAQEPDREQPEQELRAFWVDAFNEGIYDQGQVEQLVADATEANVNTLIVQVGRRFDCFCNDSLYPRTDAAIDEAPYDPLEAVIDQAHAAGLEVHAWINATTLWNLPDPPDSEDHAFNQHGPDAEGRERWLAKQADGTELVGNNAYIDPGHPDAVDYVAAGVESIIDNYDVDGVNFDYIRYPDYNDGAFQNDWGYNEVALDRYQAATGTDEIPDPQDERFEQWRRDQVTAMVRKLYLTSYEADPSVAVSVNATSYSFGPEEYGGWEQTRPYLNVLQDWRAWMEEGIVDLNVAMNYKREWMADQAEMFDQWNQALVDFRYDRHVVNGPAIYLNEIDDSVEQIRDTRAATADDGAGFDGWGGYSYATPTLGALQDDPTTDQQRDELITALTEDSPDGEDPVFAEEAEVPEMTWKTEPTTGHLAGEVVTRDGDPVDQVELTLTRRGETHATQLTDGSGWFGFVDVEPGRYQLRLESGRTAGRQTYQVEVAAGELGQVEITPIREK